MTDVRATSIRYGPIGVTLPTTVVIGTPFDVVISLPASAGAGDIDVIPYILSAATPEVQPLPSGALTALTATPQHVTSTASVNFQFRLDNPLPTGAALHFLAVERTSGVPANLSIGSAAAQITQGVQPTPIPAMPPTLTLDVLRAELDAVTGKITSIVEEKLTVFLSTIAPAPDGAASDQINMNASSDPPQDSSAG